MKIVTINVSEEYVDTIEKLVGEKGLYPSRSELIRVAVREFLIKELQSAEKIAKYQKVELEELDEKKFVQIPMDSIDELGEPIREFKTYKIVRKLEY